MPKPDLGLVLRSLRAQQAEYLASQIVLESQAKVQAKFKTLKLQDDNAIENIEKGLRRIDAALPVLDEEIAHYEKEVEQAQKAVEIRNQVGKLVGTLSFNEKDEIVFEGNLNNSAEALFEQVKALINDHVTTRVSAQAGTKSQDQPSV